MAICPKCQKKLKLWHVSQYCPYCGTNIVFHSFETNFEKDRRLAEMSLANFRVKLEKAKKAYLPGWPQKLKIAACILPLAGLFVPLGGMNVKMGWYEDALWFWALDLVYNAFMGKGYFGAFGSFGDAPVFGPAVTALRTAMLCCAVAALCAVGILLTELFCFAGNKRTGAVITAFSLLGAGATAAEYAFCRAAVNAAPVGSVFSGYLNGPLFLVPLLLFAFAAFAAILCLKKPPVIAVSEGDRLRLDYREKLRRGEIDLLDVPAPIYESEEDRLEKEKLIRGAYHMDEVKEAEEVSGNG